MKRLPPSQREKQRYLLFQIHSENDFDTGEIVNAVWRSCLSYLGTKGVSKANFWVIGNKFDQKAQQGIIRVRRDMEDDFRAALTTSKDLNGEQGFIEIKKVSGSIKSLEN